MVTAVQTVSAVATVAEMADTLEAAFAPRPPVFDTEPKPEPEPLLRLVIEEDPGSGDFVYKTIDRLTGDVVRQFPREEMLQLARQADYAPGDVIETEA